MDRSEICQQPCARSGNRRRAEFALMRETASARRVKNGGFRSFGMNDTHEVELKFTCGPADLAAVLAAAPAGDDDNAELISVYFDTPDLALQRAGASLRVREAEGRRVQTLKRGDGIAREEHETAIEGLAPDPQIGPLQERDAPMPT